MIHLLLISIGFGAFVLAYSVVTAIAVKIINPELSLREIIERWL